MSKIKSITLDFPMDKIRKIKRTISVLKELREFCACSVEKYYMSKCSIEALAYAIEILEKKRVRIVKNLTKLPPISRKPCKWWR